MNKNIKGGLLKPFEICEYCTDCEQECQGKNCNRDTKFSCGLRRGLLMGNGFNVKYGFTIDEALEL